SASDPDDLAQAAGRPFPDLRYDRVCRTPRSEAYLLSEGEQALGRVDLHFGTSVVHALLIVERDLPEEEVRRLVERIDDDLAWTADEAREDFLVTVYRGTEIGVLSDRDDEEAEDEDEERTEA
ncbi:MAG: hypothetical protein M3336_10865, partial [Chloroflexota bacterium]|nr:hypothetical protein [Chloroflexota bacterium]